MWFCVPLGVMCSPKLFTVAAALLNNQFSLEVRVCLVHKFSAWLERGAKEPLSLDSRLSTCLKVFFYLIFSLTFYFNLVCECVALVQIVLLTHTSARRKRFTHICISYGTMIRQHIQDAKLLIERLFLIRIFFYCPYVCVYVYVCMLLVFVVIEAMQLKEYYVWWRRNTYNIRSLYLRQLLRFLYKCLWIFVSVIIQIKWRNVYTGLNWIKR